MIPYFQFNSFAFGPVVIQVWGLLVSLGILAAVWLVYKLAKKYFLSEPLMMDLAVWSLVGGFLGARLFYVFFYNPQYFILKPEAIIYFWQGGASSVGGFFGAGMAVYLLAKARRLTWMDLKPYLDISVLSLWLGWGIGRLGCFFIHDHKGKLSNSILAVNFPEGARLDLGLVESLLAFVLFGVFYYSFKKLIKIRWGLVLNFSVLIYALLRFALDFWRATDLAESDLRYFHLTPAQWGMIAIAGTLTFILFLGKIRRIKNI